MKKFLTFVLLCLMSIAAWAAEPSFDTSKHYYIKNVDANKYVVLNSSGNATISATNKTLFTIEGSGSSYTIKSGNTYLSASSWNTQPSTESFTWTIDETEDGLTFYQEKAIKGLLGIDNLSEGEKIYCNKGANNHPYFVLVEPEQQTYTVHITGAPEGTQVTYGDAKVGNGATITATGIVAADITPDEIDGYTVNVSISGTDINVVYSLPPLSGITDIVEKRVYTLESVDRGYFVYSSTYASDYISGSKRASYNFDAADKNFHFVFLQNDGKTYLYSLGAEKFVAYANDGLVTSATVPTAGIDLLASTGNQKTTHPTVLRIDDSHQCNMSTDQGKGILTNWNDTGDKGNMLRILPVDELTADELAAIKEVFTQKYDFTVTITGAPEGTKVTYNGAQYGNGQKISAQSLTEKDITPDDVEGYVVTSFTINNSDYTINVVYTSTIQIELEELITTAADAYAVNDVPLTESDIDDDLIKDASYFSSPYTYADGQKVEGVDATEEQVYSFLLDGDTSTYWHSTWLGGNQPAHLHYLQVSLTEPISGSIQLTMNRRKTGYDQITKMSVEYSTDGNTYTQLPGYMTFPAGTNGEQIQGTFHLPTNASYLRFYEDETTSNRGYWHCSEFQLNKVTNSKNKQNSEVADALLNAMATAQDNPSTETIEALKAAIETYKATMNPVVTYNYTLTDANGTTYTGSFESDQPNPEPTITGVQGYSLENKVWGEGTFTATINFPFLVNTPVTISGFNGNNFLWRADGANVKVKKEDTVTGDAYSWTIIPAFADGAFTFTIKSNSTNQYITSTTETQGHAEGDVTLTDNGSTLVYVSGNAFQVVSTSKYLSVESSTKNEEQFVGVWGNTHNGTPLHIEAYVAPAPAVTYTLEPASEATVTASQLSNITLTFTSEGAADIAVDEEWPYACIFAEGADEPTTMGEITKTADGVFNIEFDTTDITEGTYNFIIFEGTFSGNVPDITATYTVEAATGYTLSISEYGVSTICLPENAIVPEGVTVYISDGINERGNLNMVELDDNILVAGMGYVVEGAEGDHVFNYTDQDYTGNFSDEFYTLMGVTEDTPVSGYESVGTPYVLSVVDGQLGFYKYAGEIFKANRAFYLNTDPSVNGFSLDFGGQTVGVSTVISATNLKAGFDIQGRKLNKMQKGINILNGKKIIK